MGIQRWPKQKEWCWAYVVIGIGIRLQKRSKNLERMKERHVNMYQRRLTES